MGWLPCVGQLTWIYSITTGSTTNADSLTNTCQWSKGHLPRMCGWSSINPSILPEKQLSVLPNTCGLIATFSQVKGRTQFQNLEHCRTASMEFKTNFKETGKPLVKLKLEIYRKSFQHEPMISTSLKKKKLANFVNFCEIS